MRIVHITMARSGHISGPKNSVSLLAQFLQSLNGVESPIYSVEANTEFQFNQMTFSPIDLYRPIEGDLVVFAGIYHRRYVAVAKQLRMLQIPYVISPRSSLMRESLRKGWLKKRLFLNFYGRGFILGSKGFHFLTGDEMSSSLSFGRPYFLSSNVLNELPAYPSFQTRGPVFTYVGRYDIQHKGLDNLLAAVALAQATLRQTGWRLVFRGPDFRNGRAHIEGFVNRNRIHDIVEVGPEITGSAKVELLQRSSVFVHTSRYEGQPQAVMEAMASGCALLLSPGSNMSREIQTGAGWMTGNSSLAIADSISRITLMSDAEIRAAGIAAREYASSEYVAEKVTQSFLNGVMRVANA